MQRGEGLGQLVGRRRAVAPHRQLERLAAVAQLVDDPQRGFGLAERVAGAGGQRLDVIAHRLGAEGVAGAQDRALGVAPPVADHEAERGEHARRARAQDPLDAQLLGHGGGVHRAGTAEGHERVAAGVDAAFDCHHPQRARHLVVRHTDDALGALALAQTEVGGQRADRVGRGLAVERHAARQLGALVQVAEQEVGVGDRRLGAAAPVAGRTRVGARAARTDAQRAAGVAPADRAAAGADRVDVEHRQGERAAADLEPRGLAHAPRVDDTDVARRAAHVEAKGVGLARRLRDVGAAGGAAGRTAQHGQGRMAGGEVEVGQAAVGLHDLRLGQAGVPRAVDQAAQIAGEQRPEGGVDLGGGGALVLAEGPDHVV